MWSDLLKAARLFENKPFSRTRQGLTLKKSQNLRKRPIPSNISYTRCFSAAMLENAENDTVNDSPRLQRQLTSAYDVVHADNIVETFVSMYNYKETLATEAPSQKFRFRTGVATDIGGGHENQDKYCLFRTGKNAEHLVMAVFDGHGRDFGNVAAITARNCVTEYLQDFEVLKSLEKDPQGTFEKIFHNTHRRIKNEFREQVEQFGDWDVIESEQGYLIKRQKMRTELMQHRRLNLYETNIHGGTTATVVVAYDSRKLFVANVGDSSALFGGLDAENNILFKELTYEHSPDCLEEFRRVKLQTKNKASLSETDHATIRFVYDEYQKSHFGSPKNRCPPIFTINHDTGVCKRTKNKGTYYKNARNEWATIVTTPPSAKFQDSLAFTRSLGDLHLQAYGVSHRPSVVEYDIEALHSQIGSRDCAHASVVLVCTDGVWDNWQYNDILRYIVSDEEYSLMEGDPNASAQKLTDSLMKKNLKLAHKHFGNQADNMAAIVCIMSAV